MNFRATRLGVGEWLSLVGAVGLLVDVFAGSWFSYPGGWYRYSPGLSLGARSGWQALSVLGPVAAVLAAAAILTVATQALRGSPAVPTVLTTLLSPVAALLVPALAVRTLLAPPDGALRHLSGGYARNVDGGAYVGLGFSLTLAIGLYLSLRREGIADADAPAEIETVRLDAPAGT